VNFDPEVKVCEASLPASPIESDEDEGLPALAVFAGAAHEKYWFGMVVAPAVVPAAHPRIVVAAERAATQAECLFIRSSASLKSLGLR
jgi:hypothetical protein